MKVSFLGANQVVTGSCHLLTACGKNIIIDCGLQQGGDVSENNALSFDPASIDAVVITHAHTDHSGRLPLMVKNGYRGPIYATRASCDLMKIMLMDSARIQESDAEWRVRRNRRAGEKEEEALYTTDDAAAAIGLLVPTSYGQVTRLFDGVEAAWYDAGHLLGSASIRFSLTEDGEKRSIIYSGDIGNLNKPIIRDPQPMPGADYVVMESTYGDRLHESGVDVPRDLAAIIDRTLARGGNVVIPAFAVGRTQELLYFIREIKERKLVRSVPDFIVYVDSPLALEATRIYDGDLTGYADEETLELLRNGFKPIRFPGLRLSRTVEESKMLNSDPSPKVIISSSGMCEAGRIRHHLKHNLWRPECSVVFVGFQSEGTLGRRLLEGLDQIRIVGEKIAVRAEICSFRFLSSHADRDGLLAWLGMHSPRSKHVFVVHGEEGSAARFAETLGENGYTATVPMFGSVYDLLDGRCVREGRPLPEIRERRKAAGRVNEFFDRLLQALDRLVSVARGYREGTNRDVRALTSDVEQLTSKWRK